MKSEMDRRRFFKHTGAVGAGLGLLGCGQSLFAAESKLADGAPNAEKLGWRLGVNTYTFELFPLFEALDKIAALGLKYAEFGPGGLAPARQTPPSSATPCLKRREGAQEESRRPGYSVRHLFQHGFLQGSRFQPQDVRVRQGHGAENLYFETTEDKLEWLDKLCAEYGLNIAIHNHPEECVLLEPGKSAEGRRGAASISGP